jgi:beta-lactamase regulating signal transducer with metallopeptidase domain
VGTSKRERQKKNRDARREQMTRRHQQGRARKRGAQVGVIVLVVVALVGFVFVTGNNPDTEVVETETDSTHRCLRG